MAKQKRAKLDKNGLTTLGIDKLIEILLEEAGANKALKARLQTALAGESSPEEMARLIDKRLDLQEQAKTRISSARAKDLAVEFSGLVRNIFSELGSVDGAAAGERILRFLSLRFRISARLVNDSARLWKVFDDAEGNAVQLIHGLTVEQQAELVPSIEKLRRRDRYGEHTGFHRQLAKGLAASAADLWKATLSEVVAKEPAKLGALDILQLIALNTDDVDGYLALEQTKAENRRDTLVVARMLHQAGRHAEALEWIRIRPPQMRLLMVQGIVANVGPEYEARERRLLEADILESLKRRSDAQEVRWKEFAETFDPEVLKLYLSKLDDFAEFEELDKALAVVTSGDDIYSALEFLVSWPRLDLAADLVLRHAARWDGRHDDVLAPAAEALSDHNPLASTLLYRELVTYILKRGLGDAYDDGASHLIQLARIAPQLPQDLSIKSHGAFLEELRRIHVRKYEFWKLVPPFLA